MRQAVPGQTSLSQQITVKEIVNYNLDMAYAEISHSEWEVESGEIGTIDTMRRELIASLSDYYVSRVFNALTTLAAIDNDVNFYSMATDITRSALEDAIDLIADTSGSIRAVVGRRTALAPITKFAGYRHPSSGSETGGKGIVPVPSTLEEIKRTGWFGMYYGANFISLEQVYDNMYDRNKLIQDNLICVIGDNIGEFITYGDVKEDQWTDMSTMPPTWHLRIYQQWGMILDNLEDIVIIAVNQ